MIRVLRTLAAFIALFAPLTLAAESLHMVERPGCAWCARWHEEIGPAYPKTPEGRFAPLRQVWLRDGAPEGVRYAQPVVFTPTFILVSDAGEELARLTGYPGADFFWPLLEQILRENTAYPGDTAQTE